MFTPVQAHRRDSGVLCLGVMQSHEPQSSHCAQANKSLNASPDRMLLHR